MQELSTLDKKLISDMIKSSEEEKELRPEDVENIDKVTKIFVNIIKRTDEVSDNLKSDDPKVVEKAKENLDALIRIAYVCDRSNLFPIPEKLIELIEE